MYPTLFRTLALAPCLALPLAAFAEPAHVHGRAQLDVAIDGPTVTLMLASPMDSLAGFEHRASSDQDKATLKTLQQKLQDARALFVFSEDAKCTLQSARVSSPLFEQTADKHEHEKHVHDDKHHDHEDKHDHEAGAHSDLDGEFVFQCASPEKLTALTVHLFDVAANLQELGVAVAGPRGQRAGTLTPGSRSLDF